MVYSFPMKLTHGTVGYSHFGCRCAVCCSAKRDADRRFRERHPVKTRERNARYYAQNEKTIRRRMSLYSKAHPEVARKGFARRKARKLDQFIEDVDPQTVFRRDKGICGICNEPVNGEFHVDHVIPLAKGGEHSYANVQLAHPGCNLRKGTTG